MARRRKRDFEIKPEIRLQEDERKDKKQKILGEYLEKKS